MAPILYDNNLHPRLGFKYYMASTVNMSIVGQSNLPYIFFSFSANYLCSRYVAFKEYMCRIGDNDVIKQL